MDATVPPRLVEATQSVISQLRAMWERRWAGITVAWIVALVGAAGLMFWSDRYEATARVFVDTQSVLRPLMAGLAVQPDVDRQVGMLARTLITRPNIEELLKQIPASGGMTPTQHSEFVERLVRNIRVTGSARDNIYNISYRDQDPKLASDLVEGLVTMFVRSGIGESKRDTDEARAFIDAQIKSYEVKLEEAEARLKDFKVRNFGYTGAAAGQDYFTRASALSEEVAKARTELRAAEQARDALRREISGEEPFMASEIPIPATPALPSETETRLEAQRRQLDEMLRRFTENHPDVIATRRTIATLEAQRKEELELRPKQVVRPSAPNNPVVQKIKIALAEAEAHVASLRSRLSDLQTRYEQLRSAAGRAPQVEAESTQLNRDYDVLRKNYEGLVARRESARMGRDVDASQQLASFRVIEPVRLLPRPVFPSREILIPLLLLAAVAAGAAASLILAKAFPTLQNVQQLRQISPRPIIGRLSFYPDRAARVRDMGASTLFALAAGGLVASAALWLDWVTRNAS